MILSMILLFVVGYVFIALEHKVSNNKKDKALMLSGLDRWLYSS